MPFKLQIIIQEHPDSVQVDVYYFDGQSPPTEREKATFEAMKEHLSKFKIPGVPETFTIPMSKHS